MIRGETSGSDPIYATPFMQGNQIDPIYDLCSITNELYVHMWLLIGYLQHVC